MLSILSLLLITDCSALMPKRPSAESLDTALDEPILTVCREATTDQSESEECEKEAAERSTSPYTPLYTNGSITHVHVLDWLICLSWQNILCGKSARYC